MVSLLVTHTKLCQLALGPCCRPLVLQWEQWLFSASVSACVSPVRPASLQALLQLSGAYCSQWAQAHHQDGQVQNLLLASPAPLSLLLQQPVRETKNMNPSQGKKEKKKKKKKEGREWVRCMQPQPSLLGWNEGTKIACLSTRWGQTLSDLLSHRHCGREAAVVNSFVPGAKSKEEISDTANQSKIHR